MNTSAPKVSASEETYFESMSPCSQGTKCPDDQKVLGVPWNLASDRLVFTLDGLAEAAAQLNPTKWNVISLIGQIYDPLGFVSPVTISFKMLMQRLCKDKLNWDQPLDGDVLTKWKKLVSELRPSQVMTLPCCYFNIVSTGDCSLYGFCDASTTAYAAVVYLVAETSSHRSSNFVAAKTRVAPLAQLTIPRLELLSALLLAQLITTVSKRLSTRVELMEPKCFTVSKIAYFWIKGTGRDWRPFVQNRVNEIHQLTSPSCWDHCSGKENSADIPTRSTTPLKLSLSPCGEMVPLG